MRAVFAPRELKITAAEAVAAALAATVALALGLPIWTMFLGWNAYFTRGTGWRSGAVNLGCVVIGVGLGMSTQFALASLSSRPGFCEQIASVFALTWVVLSLRFVPRFNNVPSLFLGLIAYFASGLAPSWTTLATLAGAALLGTFAAWLTSAAQERWLSVGSVTAPDVPRAPHEAAV